MTRLPSGLYYLVVAENRAISDRQTQWLRGVLDLASVLARLKQLAMGKKGARPN